MTLTFLATWLLPLVLASEPGVVPPDPTGAEPAGATLDDEITVTASGLETPLGETPAAVTTFDAAELDASGAATLDATLRHVPGFTLFRRSGSRAANPTTQGAALRGIGGSAASRALVLADGVPLNDPFGGWVSWSRVPSAAVERVEVLRGGASDLYGSAALAGVVHLLRRDPSERALELEAVAGEQGTGGFSAWAAGGRDRWSGAVAADAFSTDGYVPVQPAERGAVDAPAGVEHLAVEATAAWEAETAESAALGVDRVFLRSSWFDEERTNGTEVQANDTRIARLTLGADGRAGGGSYSVRLWGGDQDFRQTFSAVAADRESERKVREQDVPSEETGLTARFVRDLPGRAREPASRGTGSHTLITGLDLRRVEGVSGETVFLPSGELMLAAGGEQVLGGLYAEDLVRLSARLSAQLGLRYDRWWNREGFRSFEGSETRIPDRREEAWSPRIALHYRAADAWSLTGSAYRSFRAPTLNELYRGFRVGDVVTDPNEDLTAERLTGVELGAIWTRNDGPSGSWRVRGTLFWMELEDAVANVTLEMTPDLILRQRRNLGRIRSRGAELEASGRIGPDLTLDAGYLWTDSEVTSFPADPTLEGRRTPQVPEHQASLRLGWTAPRGLRIHLQARWADTAFDDDRNRFPLGSLTVVDLRIGRRFGESLELFVAAENLLDADHVVGRTPVTTLGSPRLARIGVRYRPGRP